MSKTDSGPLKLVTAEDFSGSYHAVIDPSSSLMHTLSGMGFGSSVPSIIIVGPQSESLDTDVEMLFRELTTEGNERTFSIEAFSPDVNYPAALRDKTTAKPYLISQGNVDVARGYAARLMRESF